MYKEIIIKKMNKLIRAIKTIIQCVLVMSNCISNELDPRLWKWRGAVSHMFNSPDLGEKHKWIKNPIYSSTVFDVVPKILTDCSLKNGIFKTDESIITFEQTELQNYTNANFNALVFVNFIYQLFNNKYHGMEKIGSMLKQRYNKKEYDAKIDKSVEDIKKYAEALNLIEFIKYDITPRTEYHAIFSSISDKNGNDGFLFTSSYHYYIKIGNSILSDRRISLYDHDGKTDTVLLDIYGAKCILNKKFEICQIVTNADIFNKYFIREKFMELLDIKFGSKFTTVFEWLDSKLYDARSLCEYLNQQNKNFIKKDLKKLLYSMTKYCEEYFVPLMQFCENYVRNVKEKYLALLDRKQKGDENLNQNLWDIIISYRSFMCDFLFENRTEKSEVEFSSLFDLSNIPSRDQFDKIFDEETKLVIEDFTLINKINDTINSVKKMFDNI